MSQQDGWDAAAAPTPIGQDAPPHPDAAHNVAPQVLPGQSWMPAGPTPGAPRVLPFGLTSSDGTTALRMVARAFLPVLVVLSVVMAVLAQIVLPDGHGGSLADWLRTAVALMALSLGGRIVAHGTVDVGDAAAEVSAGVRLIPLTITLALLILTARASMRDERQRPSTGRAGLAARSVTTGLVAGLAMGAAALLGRTSSLYGLDLGGELGSMRGGMSLGAGALGTLLGTSVFVSLAAFVARTAAARSLPPLLGPAASPTSDRAAELFWVVRALRTFAIGLLVAASLFLLVTLLYQAAVADDLDGNRPQQLAVLLALGLNGVLAIALGALAVPLALAASGYGESNPWLDMFDGSVGSAGGRSLTLLDYKPALLALLVTVLVTMGTAVRRSLHEPVPVAPGRAVQPAAVVGLVAGLLAALLLRIALDTSSSGSMVMAGDIGGSASASAGPSLLWAPLLGAAWAALVVWSVRFGPTLALSMPPRVARAVAGRRIHPEWAGALAGVADAPAGRRSAGLRAALLAAAGLAVLCVVAAIAVAVVNAVVLTPQAAAEEYLDAMADGDVRGVLGSLRDAPGSDRGLLDPDVVASDDFTPISDVSVGEVDDSGDYATVQVSYSVGGDRVEDTIDLAVGEKRYGVLRTWQVSEDLPSVEVAPEEVLAAEIAGHRLSEGVHPALAGGYTVHAVHHALLTAQDSSFVVTTDEANGPTLNPTVKPEAVTGAKEAVRKRLVACAEATELPLSNCPFFQSLWSTPELTGMRLAITKTPEFSLEYDPYAGGLTISTVTDGEVRVTGTETTTYSFLEPDVRPYDEVLEFDVDGTVRGTGENFTVEFDEW